MIQGKLTLLSRIGAGAHGQVYLAAQRPLNRYVAVKLLLRSHCENPAMLQRFWQEAATLSQVNHPHVVTIFDFGVLEDGGPFLAMEYVQGRSLKAELRQVGRLPLERALLLAEQIADGLAVAHDRLVFHRDLKPENVLLTTVGDRPDFVKIVDFGIALILQGAGGPDRAPRPAQPRVVIGTPFYMAPEQIQNQPQDHRVDIYSLGILLYELLSGRFPYLGEDGGELRSGAEFNGPLMQAHVHGSLVPLSARATLQPTPPELEELLAEVLQRQPELRLGSMRSFRDRLRDIRLRLPAEPSWPLAPPMQVLPAPTPLPLQQPGPLTPPPLLGPPARPPLPGPSSASPDPEANGDVGEQARLAGGGQRRGRSTGRLARTLPFLGALLLGLGGGAFWYLQQARQAPHPAGSAARPPELPSGSAAAPAADLPSWLDRAEHHSPARREFRVRVTQQPGDPLPFDEAQRLLAERVYAALASELSGPRPDAAGQPGPAPLAGDGLWPRLVADCGGEGELTLLEHRGMLERGVQGLALLLELPAARWQALRARYEERAALGCCGLELGKPLPRWSAQGSLVLKQTGHPAAQDPRVGDVLLRPAAPEASGPAELAEWLQGRAAERPRLTLLRAGQPPATWQIPAPRAAAPRAKPRAQQGPAPSSGTEEKRLEDYSFAY